MASSTTVAPTGPAAPNRKRKFKKATYLADVQRAKGLARAEKCLLLAITSHSNKQGWSIPQLAKLEEETGYKRQYIRPTIKSLVAKGWLRVDRPSELDEYGRPVHCVRLADGTVKRRRLEFWVLYPGDESPREETALTITPPDARRCTYVDDGGHRCGSWSLRNGAHCRHHVITDDSVSLGRETQLPPKAKYLTVDRLSTINDVEVKAAPARVNALGADHHDDLHHVDIGASQELSADDAQNAFTRVSDEVAEQGCRVSANPHETRLAGDLDALALERAAELSVTDEALSELTPAVPSDADLAAAEASAIAAEDHGRAYAIAERLHRRRAPEFFDGRENTQEDDLAIGVEQLDVERALLDVAASEQVQPTTSAPDSSPIADANVDMVATSILPRLDAGCASSRPRRQQPEPR